MNTGNEAAFQDQMVKIRGRFIEKLTGTLSEFQKLADRIDIDVADKEALESAKFQSHKILGVAATLGLARLGELAGIVELQALDILQSGASPLKQEKVMGALDNMLDEMEEVLESSAEKNTSVLQLNH